MSLPLIFILAFSPGLFWLWLIYSRDKYRPEPRALVIRTFLLGIAVSLPVVGFEYVLSFMYPGLRNVALEDIKDIGSAVYISFVVAGLTEGSQNIGLSDIQFITLHILMNLLTV